MDKEGQPKNPGSMIGASFAQFVSATSGYVVMLLVCSVVSGFSYSEEWVFLHVV